MPRATVEEIVHRRNRAIELYSAAFETLNQAESALKAARETASQSTHGVNRYNYSSKREREDFIGRIDLPTRESFMTTARRLTDTDAWAHIIEITDLERLMDKKAKDEFQQQLMTEPPEATIDNIFATLEQFAADAGTIFKRGIAECFSNLDRRFRSHDGWKIGSRVILDHAFDGFGSWSFHRNHRDTMVDIERTFCVMDGAKQPTNYGGAIGAAIETARGRGFGARQTEAETEYFLIRIFKNGNAHIWFKRDDLLEKINKLLGDYYGNPLPEERAPDADTGLNNPKTELAKNFGFYPTPDAAADRVIDLAPLYHREGDPRITVLEPSAGTGNLAQRCAAKGAIVDCIEIHGERAHQLRQSGRYRRVMQCDFLSVQPSDLYDCVVMNPPFDRERDIDHVMHAMKFLKAKGTLLAIMSAGTEFRETKKSIAFREVVSGKNGRFYDLPQRSFSSVGTNCNTVILEIKHKGNHHCYG
jgi:predicted RNA methylase